MDRSLAGLGCVALFLHRLRRLRRAPAGRRAGDVAAGVASVAGNGSLTVASGYVAAGGERTLRASAVLDVTTRIGMQSGTTPYYDIVVTTKDGKKVIAGRALRDKREAEWLAATIEHSLGAGRQG